MQMKREGKGKRTNLSANNQLFILEHRMTSSKVHIHHYSHTFQRKRIPHIF